MDFRLTAAEEAFRADVRRWLDATLPRFFAVAAQRAPRGAAERIATSKAWQRTLHDGGWAGITWPRAHGGRGASLVEQLIFNEECAAGGAPDSINLAVALGLAGPTIMACGTPEQQAYFLPRILRGDDIWCQGFSEPNAGSDLAGLRTRGVVDGDTVAVTGQKIWTSFAQYADWCILVVRTDPSAGKHRGLTFLLVDMKSPGITIRPLVELTGEAWFNEVFFDDVKVPRANVVGTIDRGWDVVLTTLAHERGGSAPHARLRRELNALIALARARGAATTDPRVRQQVAQLAVEVQVAKLTAYRNVTGIQRTGQPGPEGSILKLFWSELEQRLMEAACELLGPAAQLSGDAAHRTGDVDWTRELLWTRSATIYAGTSEVQRNIIAQRVLGLPR